MVPRLCPSTWAPITVTTAGLEVDIRREGIAGVIREMVAPLRLEAAE